MVELTGDIVQPREFIVPRTTTMPAISGALILSGATLWFSADDLQPTLITSA